jgi:hypothetical protein
MADEIKPHGVEVASALAGCDLDRLLALIKQWQSEPLEDEDGIVAELDRTFRQDPVRFREVDLCGAEKADLSESET